MGELFPWVVRYLLVGVVTYLCMAYIDLVRGPRIAFGRNLFFAAVWPAYWPALLFTRLTRGRG